MSVSPRRHSTIVKPSTSPRRAQRIGPLSNRLNATRARRPQAQRWPSALAASLAGRDRIKFRQPVFLSLLDKAHAVEDERGQTPVELERIVIDLDRGFLRSSRGKPFKRRILLADALRRFGPKRPVRLRGGTVRDCAESDGNPQQKGPDDDTLVAWGEFAGPVAAAARAQICSACPSALSAASWKASPCVGWEWMVPAMSSSRAPISMARPKAAESSETPCPTA